MLYSILGLKDWDSDCRREKGRVCVWSGIQSLPKVMWVFLLLWNWWSRSRLWEGIRGVGRRHCSCQRSTSHFYLGSPAFFPVFLGNTMLYGICPLVDHPVLIFLTPLLILQLLKKICTIQNQYFAVFNALDVMTSCWSFLRPAGNLALPCLLCYGDSFCSLMMPDFMLVWVDSQQHWFFFFWFLFFNFCHPHTSPFYWEMMNQ